MCPFARAKIKTAEDIASGDKKPPDYFAPDEEFPMTDEDEFEDVTVSVAQKSPLLEQGSLNCVLYVCHGTALAGAHAVAFLRRAHLSSLGGGSSRHIAYCISLS